MPNHLRMPWICFLKNQPGQVYMVTSFGLSANWDCTPWHGSVWKDPWVN